MVVPGPLSARLATSGYRTGGGISPTAEIDIPVIVLFPWRMNSPQAEATVPTAWSTTNMKILANS